MIELSDVVFKYASRPDKTVINISNWKVGTAERVLLHGPSGTGKSTFLNIISGFFVPNYGTVNICGTRLDKLHTSKRDRFRAENIGYVFQQFNLVPFLNAIENVKLAMHFQRSKKTRHSDLDDIKKLLQDLNISKSEWLIPSKKLSIGQQQRVAIARAIVGKPKILIADEPTSALDSKNINNFMTILNSLVTSQNITLIYVSHDLNLSKHFTRIEDFSKVNIH